MSLLIVLLGIILLLILILLKLNPMISLLLVAIVTGLLLGMPSEKVMGSIGNGIGTTLGSMVMVLALGAMMGKLIEDSGAAKKIVFILIRIFGRKNIQWAVLLTGLLVGIPLFYNAGFVVLIPLVFAIASSTGLPKLYIGLPMATALSVTHEFLPPHPGPVALAAIFHADLGKTLIYGLGLSVPIAIIAGIYFPRMIIKLDPLASQKNYDFKEEANLPSGSKSFFTALLPVVLIVLGTAGMSISESGLLKPVFFFLSDPTAALLLAVIITILLQNGKISKSIESCTEGVKSIAMIILIIAAGGAFKQILVDSGVGETVKTLTAGLNLSPLLLAWLITAALRITLGSATVAALTASGIVLPLIGTGAPAELMVLSVGAGSLMFSHVNDTGFWMFKEYFNLILKETFKTWSAMESIVSILELFGTRYQNKENAVLTQWVTAIRAAGIKRIDGTVIGDDRIFGTQTTPEGWVWQDIGNYYGAGTSGLAWRENQFDIHLKPGNSTSDDVRVLKTVPETPYIKLVNELKTGTSGSGDRSYAFLPPYADVAYLRGSWGMGIAKSGISVALPDPAFDCAYRLQDTLKRLGIPSSQPVTTTRLMSLNNQPIPTVTHKINTISSPALSEIAYWFLKKSINLYGESLLKTIALKFGKPATTSSGAQTEINFWANKGIDRSALNIIDGSGLSPGNRITTSAIANILYQIQKENWFGDYYKALPEYNGMKIQSGTINDVSAFAGYHTDPAGNKYVIVININNSSGSGINKKLFSVLDQLK